MRHQTDKSNYCTFFDVMKRIFLVISFLGMLASSEAQNDTLLSPSVRFRIFPPAKFLKADSLTTFTKTDLPKKKQLLMMVFNPDCDHCQHETEAITKNIAKFKNIHIVMATMAPISEMKQFIEKYQLDQYENIIVGRDISYFLPSFYQFHNLPFLAFYDKKQDLISEFSGSLPIEKILKEFEK